MSKTISPSGSPATKKNATGTPANLLLASRCINNIRVLCAEMVEKANSGHPGAPMGCAPIAHVLYGETMNISPKNSSWANRDRFVLSNGHACALLYAMIHLTGGDLTLDDLKSFRQLGSKTPGHPENFLTKGVEVATGPLGQGISNAVGLAIAEKHLAAIFNKDGYDVVDHYTYVLCGDGCLQEGISSEASSLAGHLGLGKLIVCYDDNHITIDGDIDLSFTEDVSARYRAYGWQVLTVEDTNDLVALRAAIAEAKAETQRPTLIKIRTVIGHGSQKAGTDKVHGAPLGANDIEYVKKQYGYDPTQSFVVQQDVLDFYRQSTAGAAGEECEAKWNTMFNGYATAYPELAAEFNRRMRGELPPDWKKNLPVYSHQEAKSVATRNRSEEVLNAIAGQMPELVGGSADLSMSNLVVLKCSGDFQKNTPQGRYIRFGVREHAMAAICNGLYAHGGFRPFCATFLNFIGYAMGSVRISALSRFGVLYIMTHDSIGLGEDGPTHQPVEMLQGLRALPNFLTIRPCDGNETVGAYTIAMERSQTPVCISLSRQATPTLEGSSAEAVNKGAYTIRDCAGTPDIVLIGTGTEVALAIDTAKALTDLKVRVVSMPCCELFDAQSLDYQLGLFPDGVPVMSIEASGVYGWEKYAHCPYGLVSFGCSAPAPALFKHFGFTVPNLSEKARAVVEFYKARPNGAPSLIARPRFHAPAGCGH